MTVKKWKHSGTKKHSMSDREIRNGLLSEKAAEEGIVLLKNDKKILPLNISTKIGLYGAGAGKTVKGGTGSGDVNNRSNISIYQGLKENGIQIVSEKWLANYESIYAEARRAWKEKILEEAKFVENPFDAYAENPFAMPEGRAVTAEDTVDAQTAIYVVSWEIFRTAQIFSVSSRISVSSTGPPEFRISTVGIFCASRNRISSRSRLLR